MIRIIFQDKVFEGSIKEYFETEGTGRKVLVFGEDISFDDSISEDGEMSSFIYLYNGTENRAGYNDGVYRINRIADRYYPDLLLKSDMQEKATDEERVKEIYLKVSAVLPPHRIHILEVTGEYTDTLKADVAGYIERVIKAEEADRKNKTKELIKEKKISEITEIAAEELHASESMMRQIRELVRYALIADIPVEDILEKMGSEGLLPVADKKEGKKSLGELQRRICGSAF